MSSYFDIADILAGEENVPVQWITDAKGIGHLDPSSATEDIQKGQDMELPLWLATRLKDSNFVDVRLPKTFSVKLRESLKADAAGVKLRDKSPHFYEVGLRMSELVQTEDTQTLPADIQATLAIRVRTILESAPDSLGKDVSKFRGGLTDLETSLYDNMRVHAAQKLRWRKGDEETLRKETDGAALASNIIASAVNPKSAGQKRERSLMSNTG